VSSTRLHPATAAQTVMRMNTTTHSTYTFLSNFRDLKLPLHLLDNMASVPSVTRSYVDQDHLGAIVVRTTVYPDFNTLFESAGTNELEESDYCEWEARHYGPAAAYLLFAGTEVANDLIRDLVGRGTFGSGLELSDTSRFDASSLGGFIDTEVVSWLEQHSAQEAAAWTAMLLAEIQMHGVALATGKFPQLHSHASVLAFGVVVAFAESHLTDVFYGGWCDEYTEEFECLGGDEYFGDVINYFSLAVREHSYFMKYLAHACCKTLVCIDSSDIRHPDNWFMSRQGSENPWLPA
jgi:hypothetical protein